MVPVNFNNIRGSFLIWYHPNINLNPPGITMIIATPDQIQTRQIQQATMKTQYRNLLVQLERRLQVAIDRQDRYLINQIQMEKDFLTKQL
jgi:hypothetical protein